jgi:hypothetical protein
VQGLIKPQGEDEGILVDAWSAAAFDRWIGSRQSGQERDDQRVDGGKRQFISSHERRSIKSCLKKEKAFLQQAHCSSSIEFLAALFSTVRAVQYLAVVRESFRAGGVGFTMLIPLRASREFPVSYPELGIRYATTRTV